IGFEKEAGGSYLANKILSLTNTTGDGYNFTNNLIWRRKFRRPGRTLSLNLSGTFGATNRDVQSAYDGDFFNAAGVKWRDSTANVLNVNESETNNFGVSFSYTEPIARDKILEFNYSHNSNESLSEREVLGFDAATGKYTIPNSRLSNNFENKNVSDRAGTNLRIVKKKYNYQLGFSVQQTTIASNNLSTTKLLNQKFKTCINVFLRHL
ncbi:MAG: outer membrane beta-barrel protein, partial [Bacteroidota bacterium]